MAVILACAVVCHSHNCCPASQCFCLQGHQTGVVVNSAALGTHPAPPPLEFNNYEAPSVAAAKYAEQYGNTTHPVSLVGSAALVVFDVIPLVVVQGWTWPLAVLCVIPELFL